MGRHKSEESDLLEAMFEHGMDLKKRRVFLHSGMVNEDIDGALFEHGSPMSRVVRSLLYLDQTDGDIELWINSPGGEETEMFGLYDVIQTLDNDVDTVGFGEVCSAACLILACGKTRFVTPNCFFMSHASSAVIPAHLDMYSAQQRFAFGERMDKRWAQLMARHTKHGTKWWSNLHRGETRELWLDAKQMLSHGIVDEIWPPDPDDEDAAT